MNNLKKAALLAVVLVSANAALLGVKSITTSGTSKPSSTVSVPKRGSVTNTPMVTFNKFEKMRNDIVSNLNDTISAVNDVFETNNLPYIKGFLSFQQSNEGMKKLHNDLITYLNAALYFKEQQNNNDAVSIGLEE